MRLVDNWRTVLVRSAANWATLAVNTIVAHSIVFLGALPFVPDEYQLPLAILIALVASSPTWLARVVQQPKMNAKIEEKRDGNQPA